MPGASREEAGRALNRYNKKDKSAGSCPSHPCSSKRYIVAFGLREHTAQLWPSGWQAWGPEGRTRHPCRRNVMVSRTSQDTGSSRKQAPSASPQPATAVVWSGAKSWEASGEPAVPKWLQGQGGGGTDDNDTGLLSKAPCVPLVVEMKVRHPSSIQPAAPARCFQAQGHSQGLFSGSL